MHDEEVLELIRKHVGSEGFLFSVCIGALLCGAAGVLMGRRVTTHWSVRHLMPHYGAVFAEARVVVDGKFISAAGVTAGLDAALVVVSLLRGDAAAQEIQLAIEYAPNPIFDSGTPESGCAPLKRLPADWLIPFRTLRLIESGRLLSNGRDRRRTARWRRTMLAEGLSSLSMKNTYPQSLTRNFHIALEAERACLSIASESTVSKPCRVSSKILARSKAS